MDTYAVACLGERMIQPAKEYYRRRMIRFLYFVFISFFFRSKGMHGTLVISGRKGNDLGVGDSTTKAYYRDGSCIFSLMNRFVEGCS
jgi:hypothetical protein